MKVVALLLIAACTFTVEASISEADLLEYNLYCLEKLGIENSIILDRFDENNLATEGHAGLNALYDCTYHKSGYANMDDSINFEALGPVFEAFYASKYPSEDTHHFVTEGINACKDIRGSENGDTYVKVYNCLFRKTKELSSMTKKLIKN